jgi:hypothetical protein
VFLEPEPASDIASAPDGEPAAEPTWDMVLDDYALWLRANWAKLEDPSAPTPSGWPFPLLSTPVPDHLRARAQTLIEVAGGLASLAARRKAEAASELARLRNVGHVDYPIARLAAFVDVEA